MRKLYDGMLSTIEAAKLMGVTKKTLLKWKKQGHVKPITTVEYDSAVGCRHRWANTVNGIRNGVQEDVDENISAIHAHP